MSISELPCAYCESTAATYCGDNATQMPCVQWGAVTVAEPATMLTDVAVGAACAIAATLLGIQQRRRPQHCTLLWAIGFALLGLSFTLAGCEHGFGRYTLCVGRDKCRFVSELWLGSMILAVVAPSCMVCAYLARHRRFDRWHWAQLALPAVAVPSYVVVLLAGAATGDRGLRSFNTMVAFLAPVMLELCGLCFVAYRRALRLPPLEGSLAAERWIAAALALVVLAQVWQVPKYNPSRWFNANDVSHTIFLCAVPPLYCGAARHRAWDDSDGGSRTVAVCFGRK